jgi:hypothetical protein
MLDWPAGAAPARLEPQRIDDTACGRRTEPCLGQGARSGRGSAGRGSAETMPVATSRRPAAASDLRLAPPSSVLFSVTATSDQKAPCCVLITSVPLDPSAAACPLPITFFRAHLDFPRTTAPLEQFRTPSTHSHSRRKKRQLKRHKIIPYPIFHFLRFWREFLLPDPPTYLFFR